ncbi:MAG: cytochrome c3 family protein [Sutterella sp.]|nr:cytochrome c3 family protein [Sutterella sp.]
MLWSTARFSNTVATSVLRTPLAQHEGALPCTECYNGHKAGVNYCGQCHRFVIDLK